MNFKQVSIFIASAFGLYLLIYYWPSIVSFTGLLWQVCLPLLLGLIMAYLLNILMNFYEKRIVFKNKYLTHISSIIYLILAILSVGLVLSFVFSLVIPELISCMKMLLSELPKITELLSGLDLVPTYLEELSLKVDLEKELLTYLSSFKEGAQYFTTSLIGVFNSLMGGISTTFLAFIFAIYLLLSKKTLKRQVTRLMQHYLSERNQKRIYYLLHHLDEVFHNFTVGQCIEACILGGLCYLMMLIFRLPYASMISVLVGFTALIPIVGAFIGAIVGFFLILVESSSQAILFVILIVILQQLEGDLIYPKVVGASIGLPGIWVFVAIVVGGGLFKIMGMLVMVPLFAFVYRLIKDELNHTGFSAIK